MKYLFDSRGRHIANLVNGQLHAPNGSNIGHLIKDEDVIIDMQGRYLGEVVQDDRLMYRSNSPYRSSNFGNHGNYGNVGNYGNPGSRGSIGQFSGYVDVSPEKLRR